MPSKNLPARPKVKSATSLLPAVARIQQLALLGTPLLLGREEEDSYYELFARLCAAVKPVDVIEEMFVADLASLHWEIMELRRWKSSLIQSTAYEALKDFIVDELDYPMVKKEYELAIVQAIEDDADEPEGTTAIKLARQCVRDEPGATEKLDKLLEHVGRTSYTIYNQAVSSKSEQLARSCVRRKPSATAEVNRLLSRRGLTLHDLVDKPLVEQMDVIDQINRILLGAETLRNATLREIDRRRGRLGAALRRTIEAEDRAFDVIEPETREEKSPA